MKRGSHKFGLVLVALALVTALVASSCAPVKVSGERVVKMGQQACFTGPGATLGVPFSSGHIDCLKPINQRGGIDGIKLEMLWEETGALVPRYVTAYRRMARKGIVISTNYLSSGTEVIVPMLVKDEIPHLYGSTGLTSPMVTEPTQWVLAAHAGFASEFVAFTKWVKQNWTESRPPRIGAFICDTGAGWDMLEGVDYFPEGVEYIGHEVLPLLGVIDSTVELLRLASKKPDYIFVTHYAGSLAVIIKDFDRLELSEEGITFIAEAVSLTEAVIDQAGIEESEGLYIVNFWPICTETHLPGMKSLIETATRERGSRADRISLNYIQGWVGTAVMVEAIRSALDKVGYENLTGKDVRDALFSIRDFDSGFGPLITTSEEKPHYLEIMRIVQVQQGRIVPVSDWFNCPRITPYK